MTEKNHAQKPSRIEQLAALEAKYKALCATPGMPLRGTPEVHRLLNRINALSDSFVLYRGQEIDATLTNEMDGSLLLALTDTMTLNAEGHERLYRTPEGQYYLRRKLAVLDVDGENERQVSGRTLVHRVSLTAAVQWAIMRCNAETTDLRRDVTRALQSARGYLSWSNHDEVTVPLTFALPPVPTAPTVQPTRRALLVTVDALTARGGHVDADGTRTFTFEYPPTETRVGFRETLGLDTDQWETVQDFAAVFELEPREFLRLMNVRELPGQPLGPKGTEDRELRRQMRPEHIAFACLDDTMARRIERAAASQELTVDEYVVSAVASLVDSDEEPLLVHPHTGETLHENFNQLFGEMGFEETAPRIGDKPTLSFLPSGARNGQSEEPVGEPEDGVLNCIDEDAASLVHRYLEVTPFDYSARDIVSGCVVLALGLAFGN